MTLPSELIYAYTLKLHTCNAIADIDLRSPKKRVVKMILPSELIYAYIHPKLRTYNRPKIPQEGSQEDNPAE